MTTIAWDGKTLAGDRMGDYGGTKVVVRKVHRLTLINGPIVGDVLISGAGDGCLVYAWVNWLTGAGEKPTMKSNDCYTGLIIDRELKIWHVEWNLVPRQVRQKQFALGLGRGEALAAMLCGRSARDAVKIAARLTVGTGCGVDVVRF